MKYFVNVSNHKSEYWYTEQRQAAEHYGTIVDIPFPSIDSNADESDITVLVEDFYNKIKKYELGAVMVQGEFTFSYALIKRLRAEGVTVLAACAEREVVEKYKPDGTVYKQSTFRFCRFREYI